MGICKNLIVMKFIFSKKQVLFVFFFLVTYNLFPQTFVEQTDISLPGASEGTAKWGDYDNDGYLEILLNGYHGDMGITIVYKNRNF